MDVIGNQVWQLLKKAKYLKNSLELQKPLVQVDVKKEAVTYHSGITGLVNYPVTEKLEMDKRGFFPQVKVFSTGYKSIRTQ
jgi:hypothetical protein